jgi:hypothetical protein
MMLAGRLSRLRFMLLRKYGFTQSRSFAHWRQPDWDLAVLRLPEHPFTGPLN